MNQRIIIFLSNGSEVFSRNEDLSTWIGRYDSVIFDHSRVGRVFGFSLSMYREVFTGNMNFRWFEFA